MAYVHSLSIAGEPVLLLRFPHDWNRPVNVDLFARANIETAETGEESRSPDDSRIRFYLHLNVLAKGEAAQEMREFLASYAGERIALPYYPEAYAAADFAASVRVTPAWVINYDAQDPDAHAVHELAAGAYSPLHKTTAPLHFGRIAKVDRAALTADTAQDQANYHLVVDDDAPDSWSLGPLVNGLPASWPAELNSVESVAESYELPLEHRRYGSRPQAALDRQEAAFRYGHGFSLTLVGEQVQTLISFFASRFGPVGAFAAPMYYTPGEGSASAPHSTIVRFASERLRLTYIDRDIASVDIQLLQLPWEISQQGGYEHGRRVYLYKFVYQTPTPVVAALASASELVSMGGLDYLPGHIEQDDIELDLRRLANETLVIRSHASADNPLQRFLPGPLQAPLSVEVWECDPADPNGTAKLLYPGIVETIRPRRRMLRAEVSLFGGLLKRPIANYIAGPDCQTHLFSRACGLSQAALEASGTVSAISGNTITVDTAADQAADWYVDGWVETGDGDDFQIREIVASAPGSGSQVLTLETPFSAALQVGAAVQFWPGCDATFSRCNALGNGLNFKGIPRSPRRNITLKTFEHPDSTQRKK